MSGPGCIQENPSISWTTFSSTTSAWVNSLRTWKAYNTVELGLYYTQPVSVPPKKNHARVQSLIGKTATCWYQAWIPDWAVKSVQETSVWWHLKTNKMRGMAKFEKTVADVAEKAVGKRKPCGIPRWCQIRFCCCVKKEIKQRRGTYL